MGSPFDVQIVVRGVPDVGAFETQLLYDGNAIHFSGLQQRQNDLARVGSDVSPLGPVILDSGVAFGFVSCPGRDCLRLRPRNEQTLPEEGATLATVSLVADHPGLIELRLSGTRLVDRQGALFDVPEALSTEIRAGDEQLTPYPAPPPDDILPRENREVPVRIAADLTGDGSISHADLMEMALVWELSRALGRYCVTEASLLELTGEGCLDVRDLQLMSVALEAPATPLMTSKADSQGGMSSIVVTSSGDEPDSNIGNGVCRTASDTCTLRAAINEANARRGPDTILFNLPGVGVQTIQLGSNLPTLSDDSGGTLIDGYSQPGTTTNRDALASNAQLRIQLRGSGGAAFDGMRITTAGNTVRGLALFNLRRAFWLYGGGARDNQLLGNFIGTNASASFGHSEEYSLAHGVHVEQGAAFNRIGGPLIADRNIISGNGRHGVGFWHEGTTGNIVLNNIVGLAPDGRRRLSNRKHGIDLNYSATDNEIGGMGPGERNVISGNEDAGVEISHSSGTRNNQVIGNLIGSDLTGNLAPFYATNRGRGVMLEDGAHNNTIAWNVIVNSGRGGIEVYDDYTTQNILIGNRVGIGLNGAALGNPRFGIFIKGTRTTIGPDNMIAYNEFAGIKLEGDAADFNTITGNSIYQNGGLGIDLSPLGTPNPNDVDDMDSGPNEQLNFPVLERVTTQEATGSACPGCVVELFVSDSGDGEYGEGARFVGAATAHSDGNFVALLQGVAVAEPITATATDPDGNTSEFAFNRAAVAAAPTLTPTETRTTTPTTTVTRTLTSTSTMTASRTATPSHTVTITIVPAAVLFLPVLVR